MGHVLFTPLFTCCCCCCCSPFLKILFMMRSLTTLTQQRHKAPQSLATRRELILACPDMHSHVNLARIVRTAALFGISDLLVCGRGRMDKTVSRGAEEHVAIKSVRTLLHPLLRLKREGWHVVGLEQTSQSQSLYTFQFPRRCVLLLGHERRGIVDELLAICHATVESMPSMHNPRRTRSWLLLTSPHVLCARLLL